MANLRFVLVAFVMTTAACSPTTNGAVADSTEIGTSTVAPTTVATTSTFVTTLTSSCLGTPDVELAFRDWTENGEPTRDVRAYPWRGYGPPWLRVTAETAPRSARFYLRADADDPRMLPTDGGGVYDVATAAFARGVSLPLNAVFAGFATRWVELWLVPGSPGAAYIVPRTNELFTAVERWPAMPSPGFCE